VSVGPKRAEPVRTEGSLRRKRRGLARPLLALLLLSASCAGIGGPVPGAPAHHREHGFANTSPAYAPAGAWTRLTFFVTRVLATTFNPRTAEFPRVASDLGAIRAKPGADTITWVGHATLLIQLDGVNVLTDPHWSARASPVGFAGPRRLTPPGLAFEDLPPIDVVLISHDHYDHLDEATVRRLAEMHKPHFLVPLGMKAWLADRGITDVEELDWWNDRVVRGLTFTCAPAQHFSGRTLFDRNRRLWSGWTVAGATKRLYFAGDTAYYAGLKEIGARLGPFDVAAVPIGAYVPARIMKAGHTTPEEALQVLADVRGRAFVPIHWGTFDLAEEPLAEPPRRLEAEARRLGLGAERVWLLKHGETRRW
jgi:N-acyl-phosphatidylethanolamine-hydrolysing phospholipase D